MDARASSLGRRRGISRGWREASGGLRGGLQAAGGQNADEDDNGAFFVGDANLPSLAAANYGQRANFTPYGAHVGKTRGFEGAAAAQRVDHLEVIEGHRSLIRIGGANSKGL